MAHIIIVGHDHIEYDVEDLDVSIMPVPRRATTAEVTDIAEAIRKRLQLEKEHRTGIASWLSEARNGDVLLMPKYLWADRKDKPDDFALVFVDTNTPSRLSRLDVTEVVKTAVHVKVHKLPPHTERVNRNSGKKAETIRAKVKKPKNK